MKQAALEFDRKWSKVALRLGLLTDAQLHRARPYLSSSLPQLSATDRIVLKDERTAALDISTARYNLANAVASLERLEARARRAPTEDLTWDLVFARQAVSDREAALQALLDRYAPRQADGAAAALLERIHQACELAEALARCSANLAFSAVNPRTQSHSPLNEDDISLCKLWLRDQPTSEADWQYRRMLSARAAERVALNYYRALGLAAIDISIQQIAGSLEQSRDWTRMDIRLPTRGVDVKNARRSPSAPNHFVEHCVPRFKLDRETNHNIAITGVLSHYVVQVTGYTEESRDATVLGEVTADDIRRTTLWISSRFPALELSGAWRPRYVAGWQFEYPQEHYSRRGDALQVTNQLQGRLLSYGGDLTRVPGWVWCLSRDNVTDQIDWLTQSQRLVLNDLRSLAQTAGLTRRSLYLYVMALTVNSIAKEQAASHLLDAFEWATAVQLPDGSARSLGLDDPLCYVASLVESMRVVSHNVLKSGRRLRRFHLVHPEILRAEAENGEGLTLLAYCGGWTRRPFVARCGYAPLRFGEHALCAGCQRLVCPSCGHCSADCANCEPRQADFAEVRSASPSPRASVDGRRDDDWEGNFPRPISREAGATDLNPDWPPEADEEYWTSVLKDPEAGQ